MAIGWLAILQTVPWGQVISNAPKVAEGAKKLWSAVGKRPRESDVVAAGTPQVRDARISPALSEQLAALEVATDELHAQMLASSELIKALADQNTQLIQRVEKNRRKVLWLGLATVANGIIAVTAIAMALLR